LKVKFYFPVLKTANSIENIEVYILEKQVMPRQIYGGRRGNG